jgi:hypothetical protein
MSPFEPPGRPRLVVNIGITGHRELPDADIPLLQRQLSAVLEQVRVSCTSILEQSGILYDPQLPLLRLLSPLAEGSDRIAARCALENRFDLQCPLPFERTEYEKDFITGESRAEFRRLLSRASSVFEIGCPASSRSKSYQNIGEIVLMHSDILIAVWTGEDNEKIGGTADIVNKAGEQHIPVVWVDARRDHSVRMIREGVHYDNWQQQLSGVLGAAFCPSAGTDVFARLYFEEKDKKGDIEWLAGFYARHFRKAGLYRHLFYFLATVAYGAGLYFGFWYKDNGDTDPFTLVVRGIGFGVQALFLLLIIWVRQRNDNRHWHQKFVDYRILAELLRQTAILTPLGAGLHGIHLPSYNKDANDNWINWYYRTLLRQGGLPGMLLGPEQLRECRAMILTMVTGQIDYHQSKAKKNKATNEQLEKVGDTVYWISLVAIVSRVLLFFIHAHDPTGNYHDTEKTLNIFCLVLPALAASAHAFAEQGGFERLGHRSEAMAEDLALLKTQFELIPDNAYLPTKRMAGKIAALMISEVSDWRVLLKSKVLRNH